MLIEYRSIDPTHDILLQSRPGARKARRQGPEDVAPVRPSTTHQPPTPNISILIENTHNRSSEAFTSAYRSAWSSITSGSAGNVLSSVRNAGYPQLVGAGIVGAELLGFFSVGEILGRFKLVGYRGGKSEEHH